MSETTRPQVNEHPSRLGQMILIRLLATGKPPTRSDLDKAFRRYFAERLAMTSAAWDGLLEGTLRELTASSLIETKPFRLTERGRNSALAQLRIESLPARCMWRTLKNRHLVAMALEIEPQSKTEWDRLSTADGLRGAVLAKYHGLQSAAVPTAAKALHELAWRQLLRAHEIEIPLGKEFTRNNVLGATLLSGLTSRKPAETLAAMAVGASGSSPDRIRDAVICRWLDAQDESTVTIGRFDLRGFRRSRDGTGATYGGRSVRHSQGVHCQRLEPVSEDQRGSRHDSGGV